MEERIATTEEIQEMKINRVLELPWDYLEDGEFICLFEIDGNICAVIRLSPDPIDNDVIWIDEFEVVRKYRKQGMGKSIICDFLKDCNEVVKLLAKNKSVAIFWEKCGFQYDNETWAEIPMVHKKVVLTSKLSDNLLV